MRVNLRHLLVISILCIPLAGCLSSPDREQPVTVAAVQFNIREQLFVREGMFHTEVERLVQLAAEEGNADLVVFPEYSSVFFSFQQFAPLFTGGASFEDGFAAVQDQGGLRLALVDVGDELDAFWGPLAGRYGVSIVAGTAFLSVPSGEGTYELRNRAFVYGSDGKRVYTQDKVFMTPFETDVLKLSPGAVEEAGRFQFGGKEIVLSICRDTFMDDWEHQFSGADLWLDLKANGDTYDQEQVENFRKALPERIAGTNVPYGITVCLTGSFLELFWEGESSIIKKEGEGFAVLDHAETWTDEDILYFTLTN